MVRPLSWFFRHLVLLVFLSFILVGILNRQAIFGTEVDDATRASAEPAGAEPGLVGERPAMESSAESSVPLK